MKEKIQESKRITAGTKFKAGSCRIGKTVFDIQKENIAKKQQEYNDKFKKVTDAYLKDIDSANAVRALNIVPMKWTVKQMSIILKQLKKSDKKLPTKKKESQSLYLQWSDRIPTAPPTINLPIKCEIKCEIENPSVNEVDEIKADVVQAMLVFAAHKV